MVATTGTLAPLTTTASRSVPPHSDTQLAVAPTTSLGGTTAQSDFEGTRSELSEGQLVPVSVAGVVVESDQQILKQHELALQRLEELQSDMIGGEKGGKLHD